MQILRKMCKKPHLSLQQIARRTYEKSLRRVMVNHQEDVIRASQLYADGPVPHMLAQQDLLKFKLLKTSRFTLGVNNRDNCCILKDWSICIVRNVLVINDENLRNHYLIVNKF